MPLTKDQAEAASEAFMAEPRRAQAEVTAKSTFPADYRAPWQWSAPGALAGALIAGSMAYVGSGNFHPWWMVGTGLGIATAQVIWRKRRKD